NHQTHRNALDASCARVDRRRVRLRRANRSRASRLSHRRRYCARHRNWKGEPLMSHHYSGPNIGFPHGDARLDLTDLYAFPKPGAPGKSVLIVNVHPSVGIKPPEPTTAEPFASDALYELMIDTDGDTTADIAYQVRFSPNKAGGQTATLRRTEGAQAAETGERGQIIAEGVPVSTGREAQMTQVGDYRFFVGWRSDPFFFDVMGTLNNFQFTGEDFFADKDICSIVLELSNSALGPKE